MLYQDVREWRSAPVYEAEAALKRQSDRLLGLADELDGAARPAGWVGDAASAARGRHIRLQERMENLVAELAAVRRAIGAVGDSIEGLLVQVSDAEEIARRHDFTIISEGLVRDNVATDSQNAAVGRAEIHQDLVDRVGAVMRWAGEINRFLLDVVESVTIGVFDDGGATSLEEADRHGDAQAARYHDRFALHSHLLDRYQVSPDPDGMVMWPADDRFGQREMTAGEARMLQDLQEDRGVLWVAHANADRDRATAEAEARFGGLGQTEGHGDAFRHAYWNALWTKDFGEDWTAEFATAHERNPASHPTAVAMDLHNNEVGRRIAVENPLAGPEELADLVDQAVRDGEMVVMNEDGQLVRSDRVADGETWNHTIERMPAEDLEERGSHRDPQNTGAEPY